MLSQRWELMCVVWEFLLLPTFPTQGPFQQVVLQCITASLQFSYQPIFTVKGKQIPNSLSKGPQIKALTASCQRASSFNFEFTTTWWDWNAGLRLRNRVLNPALSKIPISSVTSNKECNFILTRQDTHTTCNLQLNEDSVMKSLYSYCVQSFDFVTGEGRMHPEKWTVNLTCLNPETFNTQHHCLTPRPPDPS